MSEESTPKADSTVKTPLGRFRTPTTRERKEFFPSSEQEEDTAESVPTGDKSSPKMTSNAPIKPTDPRVGGHVLLGTEYIAFSGGGMLSTNRIERPVSANAYRPTTDLRSLMRVEDSCSKPLEEAKRIDEGHSTVTFSHWMNDVSRHYRTHGLDSTAFVLKSSVPGNLLPNFNTKTVEELQKECTEHNLFEEWGAISKDEILAFDDAIRTTQCQIDQTNNHYARTFLQGSVGPVLCDRIDRELPLDVSGTRLLYFIIRKLQAVSATSGRQLVDELQTIKLTAIAGHHVTDCAQKIHNLCMKIEGLGKAHVPTDLTLLVVRCFDTTGIAAFDLKVTKLENDLDDDPSSHSWKHILDRLTNKFDTLRLTKRWPPLSVDTKGKVGATGFAVQLEEVKKTLNDVKSQMGSLKSSGMNPRNGNDRNLNNVQCNYCKEKGHYKADCPVLKAKNSSKDSNLKVDESNGSKESKAKHWTRVPPKEGEPNVKTMNVEGKEIVAKYCARCRRWKTGDKAHTTEEHVSRKTMTDGPAAHSLSRGTEGGISFGFFPAITNLDNILHEEDNNNDVCSTNYMKDFFSEHSEETKDMQNDQYATGSAESENNPIGAGKDDLSSRTETSPAAQKWIKVKSGHGIPTTHAMMNPNGVAGQR